MPQNGLGYEGQGFQGIPPPPPPMMDVAVPVPPVAQAEETRMVYEGGPRSVYHDRRLSDQGGTGARAAPTGRLGESVPGAASQAVSFRMLRGHGDGSFGGVPGTQAVLGGGVQPVDTMGAASMGYAVSSDGTVIRPPPGPPPQSPRVVGSLGGLGDERRILGQERPERPEEPAKYIGEIPKLAAAEISTSAVLCGNWIAQLRQIFAGLSPTAVQWWSNVEQVANLQYQRWLVADPLDRLLLDPATVIASFDPVRYQRVESRAVSLMLAAIPGPVKDEAVSNRWLSTASLLFRIQCIYQPGGSSERAMLLSQLVGPEVVKSFSQGVMVLRRWQQHFFRVRELQAALPDSSLLLKGVDGSTGFILSQHPLLGFRVNAFRNRVSLDYNPSVASVLQLVKLLQAEFESAALSADSGNSNKGRVAHLQAPFAPLPSAPSSSAVTLPKAPSHLKGPPAGPADGHMKALEGAGDCKGKGKGKSKSKSDTDLGVCYNYVGGKGCKYGDSCKFRHDKAEARRQKRCLACGQEGHFRPDCPLVSPEQRVVQDPSSPTSVAKAPSPKRHGAPKAQAAPQAKGVVEETPSGSTGVSASGESGAEVQALMAEAAKLLKGVSLKPVCVAEEDSSTQTLGSLGIDRGWLIGAVKSASDPQYALIDSGATNALRPAKGDELQGSRVIKVDLASGATELHVNRHGTLLNAGPCQVILPAGYLVQMGYVITWKKGNCVVKKKGRQPLEVKVVKGCPLVPRAVGLQLLQDYEEGLEKGELSVLKPAKVGDGPVLSDVYWHGSTTIDEARRQLSRCVGSGELTRKDQIAWLMAVFPEAPYAYLERAAGLDVNGQELVLEGVPWNRRKRRSVARARAGEVLIHIFSGRQRWKCQGLVVEVEKSRGADLLSEGVFQHLLCWALNGVVGGVVGGPPCRTATQCRTEGDGGPPPVRDRGSHRWGLDGLAGHLRQLVVEDSVLWMRFLLVFAVAQAYLDKEIDEPAVAEDAAENSTEGDLVLPPGVDDPLELAKWALSRAAERMKQQRGQIKGPKAGRLDRPKESLDSRGPHSRRVLFVWEHPTDPSTYRPPTMAPLGGWPSWWAFPEWHEIARVYNMYEARFDQGKLGHARPKPTTLGTTSWFLFEALHGHVLSLSERARFGSVSGSIPDRVAVSSSWSCWAPGLSSLVQKAWFWWGKEQGLWDEVQVRQAWLAKLTEQEMQRVHELNDHIPFKKGCPVCISAQARQRSHWRSAQTGVFSASCDLAGPFLPGKCFDPVASGRDKGLGYRYFLACAFSVPISPKSVVEATSPGKDQEPSPKLEPESSASSPDGLEESAVIPPQPEEEVDEGMGNLWEAMDRAVRYRARAKRPEKPDELSGEGVERVDGDPPLPPPSEPPPVKTRTLCLGIPLRSKKGKEVMGAVQSMLNRLEACGFPVHRYHADRAQEVKSRALVAWLRDKGIHATWTPGDTPAGNKAELAVQQLKGSSRKLLSAAGLDAQYWPLAILHASNRHWVELCSVLGVVHAHLLPFGLKVHARQRTKTGFLSHWRSRTVAGRYLGQAPCTPGGHLVLLDSEGGDKVLLTNTVYPIGPGPVKAKGPRYRLRDKSSPAFVMRIVPAVPLRIVSAGRISVTRLGPGGECVHDSDDSDSDVQSFGEGFQSSDLRYHLGQEGCNLDHAQKLQQVKGIEQVGCDGQKSGRREVCGMLVQPERLPIVSHSALHTPEECLQMLEGWVQPTCKDGASFEEIEVELLLGLDLRKSPGGVTPETIELSSFVTWMNGFVGSWAKDLSWTTLQILHNRPLRLKGISGRHSEGEVWVMTLGRFQGGGLWIESEDGQGTVVRHAACGKDLVGSVVDATREPARFDSGRGCAIEPWYGDLWLVKAFTSGPVGLIEPGDLRKLREFGFQVDAPRICSQEAQGSETPNRNESCIGVEGDQACLAEGAKGYPLGQVTEVDEVLEEVWEVEFPHQVVGEDWLSGALYRQHVSSGLCKRLSHSLGEAQLDPEELELAAAEFRMVGKFFAGLSAT